MTKMFTLLCKLITLVVNSFILFQSNRKDKTNAAAINSIQDNTIMVSFFARAFSIVSNRVNNLFARLLQRTGVAREALPGESGIHQHPYNLSPVAAMQPVCVYTTTTPQTNRMKQVLRKSTTFILLLLIANLFFSNESLGQLNTGAKAPTSNVNIAASVTTPQNGYVSDNQYAVFDANGDAAIYGGFSFLSTEGGSIPATALVAGIQVSLEGNRPTGGTRDLNVALTWNNGTNLTTAVTLNPFTNGDVIRTMGAPLTDGGVPGQYPT